MQAALSDIDYRVGSVDSRAMETAHQQPEAATKAGRKRGPGRPFQPGDQRINKLGRGLITPEERAEQALKERVAGRVITDLAAEMKTHAAVAVDALRKVIQNGKHADQINAARVVLSYSHGMPVQSVDARVAFEGEATQITAADIKLAALRIAGQQAEDA